MGDTDSDPFDDIDEEMPYDDIESKLNCYILFIDVIQFVSFLSYHILP